MAQIVAHRVGAANRVELEFNMPLEWRLRKDGTPRPVWYGRFKVNNVRRFVCLNVPMEGRAPASLLDEGDHAFERSRARAQVKLEEVISEAQHQKSSEALVQKIHAIRYGERIKSFPIRDLIQAWEAMPKKKGRDELHPRYVTDVHATLRRFVDFMRDQYAGVVEAEQVNRTMALEFMASEESRGLAAKARNDTLKRLRAVFKFLQIEYGVLKNPFDGIRHHTEHHVHRRPLDAAERQRLLDAVAGDDFLRPIIVCGLETAMRLGDCCKLDWASVHLDEKDAHGHPSPDHLAVASSKTGASILIPVSPKLRNELERALPAKGGKRKGPVWPAQAAMYANNPQGLTYRVGKAFAKAGFSDGDTQRLRTKGMRKASVVDFHSLRTTWITDQLSRGTPIETVRMITGHQTTEVVLRHYFKPRLAQLAQAIHPTNPTKPVMPGLMRDLQKGLKRLTPANLKDERPRLLALLAQLETSGGA
jgi:integrase